MEARHGRQPNRLLMAAGLLGATAVVFGAFAAHGLEDQLAALRRDPEDIAKRVENFQTGARYQLHAAAALLAVALSGARVGLLGRSAWALAAGAVLFCVLLYALAIVGSELRWLGAIVPLGGLAMIAGWTGFLIAGLLHDDLSQEASGADSTQRMVYLEELLTHQQQALSELNEVITETRSDHDKLSPRLAALETTARRLVELSEGAEDTPDERPPHY